MEIIHGMSNANYHAHPSIGSSRLKLLSVPAKFKHQPEYDSPALRFGSAFHAWVEGNPIHIAGLDCPRRSNDDRQRWENFFNAHGSSTDFLITDLPASEWDAEFTRQTGRIIASPAQIAAIQGMTASIAANPDAMACLTGGQSESSIFWDAPETGISLKCRPDHLNPLFCGELKTAADASERGFQGAVMRYGYHISAAMYLDGIEAVTGTRHAHRFVVVEKNPPYLCAVYQLSDSALAAGYAEYRRLLNVLRECRNTNTWPGLPGNLELDLPAWAYPDDVLTSEVIL